MGFFDFCYNGEPIYSCQTEEEFWFCLRNLSLRVVNSNWQNGSVKKILHDAGKVKEAEFIIAERLSSAALRRKKPRLFSIRSSDELPRRSFKTAESNDEDTEAEKDPGQASEDSFEILEGSGYECPGCSVEMFFVKDAASDKHLWCCECNFSVKHKSI